VRGALLRPRGIRQQQEQQGPVLRRVIHQDGRHRVALERLSLLGDGFARDCYDRVLVL